MSRIFKGLVVGILILTGLLMMPVGDVNAAIDDSTKAAISGKAVAEGINACLKGQAINSSFKASEIKKFVINDLSDETVKLPFKLTDVGDNNLNCRELMFGVLSYSSGLRAGIIPKDIRTGAMNGVAKFFSGDNLDGQGGLHYEATGVYSNTTGNAQKLTIKLSNDKDAAKACGGGTLKTPTMELNGNGVSAIVFPTIIKNASGGIIPDNSKKGEVNVPWPGDKTSVTFQTSCGDISITVIDVSTDSSGIAYEVYANEQSLMTIGSKLSGNNAEYFGYQKSLTVYGDTVGKLTLNGEAEDVIVMDTSGFATDYTLTYTGKDGMNIIAGLNASNNTGFKMDSISDYGSLKLSPQEVFDLYRYYITDVYKAPVSCEGDSDYDDYANYDMPEIKWSNCGICRIDKDSTSVDKNPGNVYGVDSSSHFTAKMNSIDDVIAGLNSLDITGLTTDDECGDDDSNDSNDPNGGGNVTTTSSKEIVDCNDFDIGAMQWILCPVMNNEQYTVSWIEKITRSWLEVKTDLYSGSGIEDAWSNVRNIANVLMIVFLLIIIFSQVTGYGIDNYGVKKMLPRLIVMAVLINLSLYICQIAVDLSNIAGTGLREIFTNINTPSGSGTSFLKDMVTGIFASAATGGSAAVSAGVLAASLGAEIAVAAVIGVIVLLLVVLVAVMVMFVMLGAREVIILVCIVLSPLAFAAYILPNTQNLYKKWWELFKAAIIIFPICGAMAGISNMLRGLYNTDVELDLWGYAVLIMLPYLGFFLIPMLLKNAISALGKVGGALTAMGNTVKNGGKAIGQGAMKIGQNTEAFKTMQEEAARRRRSESAQRTIDRMKQIQDSEGSLTDSQKRQLARAHEVQRKLSNENTAASTILMEKEYAGKSQEQILQEWDKAFDNGDTSKMDALTNVIVSRYGPGGVNSIAKNIAAREGANGIFNDDGGFRNGAMERSFIALQTNMMQNKGLASAMQNKASDVYQMITSGGFVDHDANGNAIVDINGKPTSKRQNLSAHSANNSMATQIKDWATQSSATLERAAASGALTPDMMREILDSNDPTVQSGIKSDVDKRRILEAGVAGFSGDWKDKGAVAQAAQQYKDSATRERDAEEYEQTWQALLNQRDQAEMVSNISRIANAINPQGAASASNGANVVAAGAQSVNANTAGTQGAGATGNNTTTTTASLANSSNHTQTPQAPQSSNTATPLQGGSIPQRTTTGGSQTHSASQGSNTSQSATAGAQSQPAPQRTMSNIQRPRVGVASGENNFNRNDGQSTSQDDTAANTTDVRGNNPQSATDLNIDHSGDGADEIPE